MNLESQFQKSRDTENTKGIELAASMVREVFGMEKNAWNSIKKSRENLGENVKSILGDF